MTYKKQSFNYCLLDKEISGIEIMEALKKGWLRIVILAWIILVYVIYWVSFARSFLHGRVGEQVIRVFPFLKKFSEIL